MEVAIWTISRKARTGWRELFPSRLATSYRTHPEERKLGATNSAQHVVSKGNARSPRLHDYLGGQGRKKLAKLSVHYKRTSKRG